MRKEIGKKQEIHILLWKKMGQSDVCVSIHGETERMGLPDTENE